eukprot:g24177.t1
MQNEENMANADHPLWHVAPLGPHFVRARATSLRNSWQNTKVKTLNLSFKNLGDRGAAEVVTGLQDHPSITSVDLRCNNLSVESGLALAAVAKQNPRIKVMCEIPLDSLRDSKTTNLNLTRGTLGPAEAAILAEFLKVSKVLQHLSFSDSRVGADGLKEIAAALKVSKALLTSQRFLR